jgi:hypothetical protein
VISVVILLNFSKKLVFTLCAFYRSYRILRGSVLWPDLGSLILPVPAATHEPEFSRRCPKIFHQSSPRFCLCFSFPAEISHSSASFLRVGFVDLTTSCQCVVPGLVFSVSFPPGVRRSLLLNFFLLSDPSFVFGPGVLGLAAANFCGYSVLLRALSQQIWSRACRSESPSSVCFISSSKTSSFVFDLISAEFLSLLTRLATIFLFSSLSGAQG